MTLKQKGIGFSRITLEQLDYLSEKLGESRSQVIARAIEHYIKTARMPELKEVEE
jgi:predicted DNA-binding protein